MRHKVRLAHLGTATAGLVSVLVWYFGYAPAAAQTGGSAVRPAPAGERFAGKPGVPGATYYGFEGKAVRTTTEFANAIVVSRRSFDADIVVTVANRGGNEVAQFKVDAVDSSTHVLRYTPSGGTPIQAYANAGAHPTLDWANRQAYALWKDGSPASVDALEWRGDVMRRKGAPLDALTVQSTETEWPNGMVARTVRRSTTPRELLKGRVVKGDVLVTHLTFNGTDVGTLNWFGESQLLAWDLPGLTRGYVGPEHLKEFGGWPFVPDATWLNVQAMAFHHFKTLIQSRGYVADRSPAVPTFAQRVASFFVPTVLANEEGCDDLHWLDGTILRFCCDVHDLCYEKNGCSSRSWWQFWSSWTCDACNAWVVICFITGDGTFSSIGMMK